MKPRTKLNIGGYILSGAGLFALLYGSPNASIAAVGAVVLFTMAWAESAK